MVCFGMSLHLQHSAHTVKAQCMHCEWRESTENYQQKLCWNAIECHASSVATRVTTYVIALMCKHVVRHHL